MLGAECLSLSISQIDYLVSVLSKKSNKAAFSEILEVILAHSAAISFNSFCFEVLICDRFRVKCFHCVSILSILLLFLLRRGSLS